MNPELALNSTGPIWLIAYEYWTLINPPFFVLDVKNNSGRLEEEENKSSPCKALAMYEYSMYSPSLS